MKTLQKTLLALAAGSLLSVGAQAAVAYGNGYAGHAYVGVHVGQCDIGVDGADDPSADDVDDGDSYEPHYGIEAEYVGSDDANYRGGDSDAKTFGAYCTHRYAC